MLDLKKQYSQFRREAVKRMKRLMGDQDFILGKEVELLEERIARYCGTKYAVGVASGTDALLISLKALHIGNGDEIITTPFTFMATAEAIVLAGARPVFVDIDRDTYGIDTSLIERAITSKTKAIMPVHLYGLCVDMDPILKIAARYGLKVIEDAAQAIGSEYKGRRAGSLGDTGAISFYPSKNLGAFGDGGMVVTNDKKIYDRARLLRVHGMAKAYLHVTIGYNSRLDNLQAGILNIKLKYLDKWIEARMRNAAFFNKRLNALPLKLPLVPTGYKHSYHLYVLRSSFKDRIEDHLAKNGIETRTYYPLPLHLQRCFKYLGYNKGTFPEAEKASEETFSIPIYPELSALQKGHIVRKTIQFFNSI